MTVKDLDFCVIDAHSHLWLRQEAVVDGQRIFQLSNGRSIFFGEERQMLPPFMVDGRNTAGVFLSNMDYARVSATVVVQEFIDGLQNDYLAEVRRGWPERFRVCAMCDFRVAGFLDEARCMIACGRFDGIAIPGHRLARPLDDPEMMAMYAAMERCGMFLSLCLHEDNHQLPEVEDIIASFPDLRIAIGHFGMVTAPGWLDQVRLARHSNVYVESGGITWLFNDEFYPFDGAVRAIRQAADEVGMEKLMWGSDYPRTITAITYRMSYDFILKSDLLSDDEKRLFLGGNAKRFYGFEDLFIPHYVKNMSE